VCAYEHDRLRTPDDNGSVVAHMKADAAGSAGKQSISWQSSDGANIAFVIQGRPAAHGWGTGLSPMPELASSPPTTAGMMRPAAGHQVHAEHIRSVHGPAAHPNRSFNHLGAAFWTNMPLTDASKWAGMAKLHRQRERSKSITLDPARWVILPPPTFNSTTWNTAKSIVAHQPGQRPLPRARAASSGGGGGGFSC